MLPLPPPPLLLPGVVSMPVRRGLRRCRSCCCAQVSMMAREQVTEPLLTGVKALDVLTPVGRGSSMLVIGRRGSGKAALVEDAVLGQAGTGTWVHALRRALCWWGRVRVRANLSMETLVGSDNAYDAGALDVLPHALPSHTHHPTHSPTPSSHTRNCPHAVPHALSYANCPAHARSLACICTCSGMLQPCSKAGVGTVAVRGARMPAHGLSACPLQNFLCMTMRPPVRSAAPPAHSACRQPVHSAVPPAHSACRQPVHSAAPPVQFAFCRRARGPGQRDTLHRAAGGAVRQAGCCRRAGQHRHCNRGAGRPAGQEVCHSVHRILHCRRVPRQRLSLLSPCVYSFVSVRMCVCAHICMGCSAALFAARCKLLHAP